MSFRIVSSSPSDTAAECHPIGGDTTPANASSQVDLSIILSISKTGEQIKEGAFSTPIRFSPSQADDTELTRRTESCKRIFKKLALTPFTGKPEMTLDSTSKPQEFTPEQKPRITFHTTPMPCAYRNPSVKSDPKEPTTHVESKKAEADPMITNKMDEIYKILSNLIQTEVNQVLELSAEDMNEIKDWITFFTTNTSSVQNDAKKYQTYMNMVQEVRKFLENPKLIERFSK